MTQGNDHGADVAEFGKNEFAGIGDIVGIADPENLATAIQVADSSRVFRARSTVNRGGRARGAAFALALHDAFLHFLVSLKGIVMKAKQLKNSAKVIDLCPVENGRLQTHAWIRLSLLS